MQKTCVYKYSLTKLVVSRELLRWTVTDQIAFDQLDSKFRTRDGPLLPSTGLLFFSGFQIGNIGYHQF